MRKKYLRHETITQWIQLHMVIRIINNLSFVICTIFQRDCKPFRNLLDMPIFLFNDTLFYPLYCMIKNLLHHKKYDKNREMCLIFFTFIAVVREKYVSDLVMTYPWNILRNLLVIPFCINELLFSIFKMSRKRVKHKNINESGQQYAGKSK